MVKIEILNDASSGNLGIYYVENEVAKKMLDEDLELPFAFNGLIKQLDSENGEDVGEYKRLALFENTQFRLQKVDETEVPKTKENE